MPVSALRPDHIAKYVQSIKPSATLAINERSIQLLQSGKTIYRLGFGQSPFPVPVEVVDTLKKHAAVKDYLPVQGLPELRSAVARFNQRTLNIQYTSDDIIIGPGSKELIYQLQLALDAVLLLPNPSWVSYEPQAKLAQREVQWINTHEEEAWCLSPQALDESCLQNPDQAKILILNYPNNPSGSTYNKSQLEALASIAKKHQLLIIADEIYSELHHLKEHHSIASFYPEGTIISSGLSKWCGAGGWRLGTFTIPKTLPHLKKVMLNIASETFTSVSAPIQYAAVTAFEGSVAIDHYIQKSCKILQTIGNYTHRRLLSMQITTPQPAGGFYLFPNFKNHKESLEKKGITSSQSLCQTLLDETGIALLPGVAFGRPAEELTARLSFVDFDGEKLLTLFEDPAITIDETFISNHFPKIKQAMDILSAWL